MPDSEWDAFWAPFDTVDLVQEYVNRCDYILERKVEIIKEWIRIAEGTCVLEVGCGTARSSLRLSEVGARVFGVDISSKAVQIARGIWWHTNCAGKAAFIRGDVRAIPFPSDTFDLVWNSGVLEHFHASERKAILEEMMRVAKPGGAVVVFVPNALNLRWSLKYRLLRTLESLNLGSGWPWGREEMFTTWGLKRLFECAGLSRIKLAGVCFSPLPWFHLDRSVISGTAFGKAYASNRPTYLSLLEQLETRVPLLAKWLGKDICAVGTKPGP